MENQHSGFTKMKMVIFHSYVTNYQRVSAFFSWENLGKPARINAFFHWETRGLPVSPSFFTGEINGKAMFFGGWVSGKHRVMFIASWSKSHKLYKYQPTLADPDMSTQILNQLSSMEYHLVTLCWKGALFVGYCCFCWATIPKESKDALFLLAVRKSGLSHKFKTQFKT